jgi:hypothetical protein
VTAVADGEPGTYCADTLRLNKVDAEVELAGFLFQNGRFSVGWFSSLDRSSEASEGVPVGLMPEERPKLDDGRYFGSVSLASRRTASLMPDTRPTMPSTAAHSLSPAGSTGATVATVLADRGGGSAFMAREARSRASFQPV